MVAVEPVTVDVLVIGGGLAALRAAVAAREQGVEVAVAVKGRLGRSGSSAMTSAGYVAVVPCEDTQDSIESHYEDTLRGGAYIGDPRLVRVLCEEAARELEYLESIGCSFARTETGYQRGPSGDHTHPRVLSTVNQIGTDLTLPLVREVERLGVRVFEFTMALQVLVQDGRTVGALCIDLARRRLLEVTAPAVMVATGGCGRLFPVTSNPNDVTGDGYALAARAGAWLRDMEFIQFYPWRCIDPFDRSRMSIQAPTFVLGARMYNSRGERFMVRYNPEGGEATTRDVAARAIFDQIRQGLGVRGGVRLDLSALSPEAFETFNPKAARALKKRGIDYRTYEFILAPEAHYFMGGVRIDEFGQSSVEGLFAAGEVAGGIHGANRIDSNALPDTVVFGRRAGTRAATVARRGSRGTASRDGWERWASFFSRIGTTEPAVDPREATKALQERMGRSLGIIRNGDGIEKGIAYVRDLRRSLRDSAPSRWDDVRPWIELGFLCDVAELCLTAALMRTESRGAHYREDFPHRDDARWKKTIMVRRDGDNLVHEVRPVSSEPAPALPYLARAANGRADRAG